MFNKTSKRAPASWGPIENPIDKETLELWRRLDADAQGQSALLAAPAGPSEIEDAIECTEDEMLTEDSE